MDLGLRGKRAFVTGGTHGIGLAIASELASEGVSVAVCGRDEERLDAAVAALGPEAYGIKVDVTDAAALGIAIDEAATRLGGIDHLVANVGGGFGRGLLESTPEDWTRTFEVNVLHAANAVRSAVPHLSDSGGSVVIVSSITGWKPGPSSSYASAKAAEIHLAAVLGRELGPRGIRVNALSPGSVLFEGGGWGTMAKNDPERFATFAREDFPRGRLVELREVADVACFLLSERASGVNGANICVDAAQDHPTAGRLY